MDIRDLLIIALLISGVLAPWPWQRRRPLLARLKSWGVDIPPRGTQPLHEVELKPNDDEVKPVEVEVKPNEDEVIETVAEIEPPPADEDEVKPDLDWGVNIIDDKSVHGTPMKIYYEYGMI